MKPHLQCAEQQVSRSNLTKYWACHAERLTYLIIITYETSFTMRGATGVTIQPHQILRLSRRKTHLLNHHYIWNLIYNARSNRCHDQNSPNTAPVAQKDSHFESSSHMKRHLQCAEQLVSRSNLTKYCACHAERLTYLVVITYETSFPLPGETGLTIQPHQILPLPRKNCIAKVLTKSLKTDETSFPMRGTIPERSENDPTMIREWSDHENANRNPPRKWGCFSSSPGAFSIVKYNNSSPILHSNIHQVLRLPQKVTIDLHQILPLPRKVTLELHQILPLPRKVTLELHQVLRLPQKGTLDLHQILPLPRKVTLELHQIRPYHEK